MPALLALALALAPAQEPQPPVKTPAATEQHVALVLSSGGSRGLAHIGALAALEELHVPVELVVGSEWGALVGGLYASGLTPAEIEHALVSPEWVDALSNRTPRSSLSYRAKQEDREFLLDLPISIDSHGLVVPPALLGGERLRLEIARFVMGSLAERDFDLLPCRFRAVATDLESAQACVLGSGSLATAIESSFATPVLYPPVRAGGRLLASGALGDPLPVAAAQALGADVVIAVDVFDPQQTPQRPDLYDIGLRVLGVQGQQLEAAARAALRPQDLLCQPAVEKIESLDFARARAIIELGRASVLAQRERIAALALDEARWQEWGARRAARRPVLPRLAGVRTSENCPLSAGVVRARIDSETGASLDERTLGVDLARLYGLRLFQRVDLELLPAGDGRAELLVRTEALPTAPLHWRVGMQGEFTAGSQVNFVAGIGLRCAPTDANGSEWRAHAEVGNRFLVSFEHRQALDARGTWFLAPTVEWARGPVNVDLGVAGSAQFTVEVFEVGLDLVHEFADSWELRVGPAWMTGSVSLAVGDSTLDQSQGFQGGGVRIGLAQDSLDDTAFPRAGSRLQSEWFVPAKGIDPEQDETVKLAADQAFGLWQGSMVLGAELSTVTGSNGSVQSFFPLGGFLRLSGLHADEISGPTAVLARAVYLRPFGARTLQRRAVDWFGGASLEAGNVFASFSDIRADEARAAGSIFIGVDTLFGPLYTGLGATESSGTNFFFVLGRYF